jgi:DNA-binding CsgD family transcriptional regulator
MALTGEIPLMSREAELGRILAKLKGPDPAAFVLAGQAGVGKSRLASEAARAATGLGFKTARAVATRSAALIPFGPFARFLPETDDQSGDLLGLLRQVTDAIGERAGPERRLLLVVDDAQLLDDGSAALVHQLVQERTCSVVASMRTPGPAPDPVTALWKDGLAERIDLDCWDEAETGAVVSAVLDGPVARGTVRRLWELSRGNALYLRELLIGAVESGAMTESGGIWTINRPLTAPGRLVELVAARLAGLTPETVAVIELLAAGEPLGMRVLERLTDPAGLENAEAQGLVVVRQDGRRTEVRLAHPVYGEALRQSMPRLTLRRISATLVCAIEATGARRREDLLRLGRWQLDSGAPGEAALLTRAARRAVEMFDLELAARLAQAALDSGGGADAGLILGEARFRSGRSAEAEEALAAAIPRCVTDKELARIANARAYNFHNMIGDPVAARAVLDEALAVVTDPLARLQLLGRLASIRLFEADPDGALAAAAPLLASQNDVMKSRGNYVSSIALALLGRTREAVEVAYAALAADKQASGLSQIPEAQLIGAVSGHIAGGRLEAAEADAATAFEACLAAGDKEGQATWLFLTASVLIERGQLTRAARAFQDATAINRQLHDQAALRWSLAGQALAEAMSGHSAAAAKAAAERDELPVSPMAIYEADLIERSRAWNAAAVGELSQACQILAAAAGRAATTDMRIAEARLLHDVARLGQPALAAPRLAALAKATDSEFVAAQARHAAALIKGNGHDLEAAAQAFEELKADLLAAEAYLAAAASYRSKGLARQATNTARRAGELAAPLGDVRTPGLSLGSAGREQLTRREREIAAMAAAGAASRDIAVKLVLSVRTVDNHLQSVYSKLGVTSRDELARVLRA